MLIPLLSTLAALCAVLTIAGKLRQSPRVEAVFKALTMVCIILIALTARDAVSARYRALIVAGLLASLAGDMCLLRPDRFLPGLISFLIAHLFYIAAFTLEGRGTAPLWYAVPFALYGALILRWLWPHLGALRGPVLIYVGVILLMAWQAANRWIETDQDGALLALVGAYLFVASDSVLAVERFRGTWRGAPFWVLSTYFAAQWLIALSV